MSKQPIEDSTAPPWLKLHTALCFLSLDGPHKSSYLPNKMPQLLFHLAEGDLLTDNPLVFMAVLCNQECRKFTDNSEADELLRCIVGVLEAIDYDNRWPVWYPQEVWAGREDGYSPSIKVWDALGYLAKGVLRAMHWEVMHPRVKCEVLMDEYSYGAYTHSLKGNA